MKGSDNIVLMQAMLVRMVVGLLHVHKTHNEQTPMTPEPTQTALQVVEAVTILNVHTHFLKPADALVL